MDNAEEKALTEENALTEEEILSKKDLEEFEKTYIPITNYPCGG